MFYLTISVRDDEGNSYMSKKGIVLSIKPKWVDLILKGEKTIEIRKRKPNCKLPIDVYIYCSKGNDYENSGKVCAKFTLNECLELSTLDLKILKNSYENVVKDSKVSYDDILHYVKWREIFYGWKIDSLERVNLTLEDLGLTKAPQSYCYVERKLK